MVKFKKSYLYDVMGGVALVSHTRLITSSSFNILFEDTILRFTSGASY